MCAANSVELNQITLPLLLLLISIRVNVDLL